MTYNFRYRERLHLKFLKSKRSAIYNGVNWTFIPSGTDDFRTGIPRNTSGTILHQWSKPVPLIGMAGTRKTRSYCSRLNMGDETRFSKSVVSFVSILCDVHQVCVYHIYMCSVRWVYVSCVFDMVCFSVLLCMLWCVVMVQCVLPCMAWYMHPCV